jgi:hypothetical protein
LSLITFGLVFLLLILFAILTLKRSRRKSARFCLQCGRPLRPGAKYCTHDGTPVRKRVA